MKSSIIRIKSISLNYEIYVLVLMLLHIKSAAADAAATNPFLLLLFKLRRKEAADWRLK